MKYFVLFAICLFLTSVIFAVNAHDHDNGEIVTYDVSASSDAGFNWGSLMHGHLTDEVWAYAKVSAETGCIGYFTVWAEAGTDRGNYDGGEYTSGRNGFNPEERAKDYVYMGGTYTWHSASIYSQDDEDWSPHQ